MLETHFEIALDITSLALANLPLQIQPAASKVTAMLSIKEVMFAELQQM